MENMKRKWAFIINPVAGNGFAGTMVPILKKMIAKYNLDAEIVLTERSGHASRIVQILSVRKDFNYIIGVGGDGTFNEIARPLVNNKNVTVGYNTRRYRK